VQSPGHHAVELLAVHQELDDRIERALRDRRGLRAFLGDMAPWLANRIGATSIVFQTYGETLDLETFPSSGEIPAELLAATDESSTSPVRRAGAIGQRLDVAGEWFGRAIALFDAPPLDPERAALVLDAACEELDNFLYAIRAARQKHRVVMKLGDALRHHVLAEGLRQAVAVLADAVPIQRFLLVFVAEESRSAALHVALFEPTPGGLAPIVDTMTVPDAAITTEGRRYLREGDRALLVRLGLDDAQEEVLISGVTHSVVVGKILLAPPRGRIFDTFDRELLAAFAGFVRQRIVDFNKEWRRLSASFRPEDVARLVGTDDYERELLAPREEQVGILYVDIAGFTRLSEQVLKTPERVAALVEAWSQEAVDLLFAHGGVFDKMVGDCVIGLFGPPFYDQSPGERLAQAIRCARGIRAMTAAFPDREGFEHLRASGLGVSTGVNLAPLFVGMFGKNNNFTGFSSGMNNTARLQGCAHRGEILVMAEAIAGLREGEFEFGPERSAVVKNVAAPLRYRSLSA
jgi:class 3 adenylate cyclase